jgi:hypothetical protein
MTHTELNMLTWHKSTYSGWREDGNCVEVAFAPEAVAMRDSKDPDGPALVVSPAAFARFVRGLR